MSYQTVEAVKVLHVNAEPVKDNFSRNLQITFRIRVVQKGLLLCFDVRVHCVVKQLSDSSERPSV